MSEIDIAEFPVVEDVTDNLPRDIPSSAAVRLFFEDELGDGVFPPRDRESEIVAQSDIQGNLVINDLQSFVLFSTPFIEVTVSTHMNGTVLVMFYL